MEQERNTNEISVTWRGNKYVVTMNLGATLEELGHELQKLTAVKADTLKLIVQHKKSSKLLSPFSDEHSRLTLQEAFILEVPIFSFEFFFCLCCWILNNLLSGFDY